jgi:hypothetical protein
MPSANTDYRNIDNWMLLPKHLDHPVDVFYVYPTAYFPNGEGPLICRVDDPAVRERATEHVTYKGSAFMTVGDYYVPFYRQACVECLISDDREDFAQFTETSLADIQDAFLYYMANLNNGRPFILAGHSQGSILLSMLLATTFKDHPEFCEQLVAAYIVGFGITREYLDANPLLRFAEGRADTGVIVSYNTEAPGVTARNITLPEGAICINPISWTRSEAPASARQSLGSSIVIRDSAGRLESVRNAPHYADAAIDAKRGVVVCSTADPDLFRIIGGEAFFARGILHNGDYSLYYYDIRQNAQDRVDAFMRSRRA